MYLSLLLYLSSAFCSPAILEIDISPMMGDDVISEQNWVLSVRKIYDCDINVMPSPNHDQQRIPLMIFERCTVVCPLRIDEECSAGKSTFARRPFGMVVVMNASYHHC